MGTDVSPPTLGGATVSPVSISMTDHFWYRWALIAIDHEKEAQNAREDLVAGDMHGDLQSAEQHAAMVAISAAAHALDALYGLTEEYVERPEGPEQEGRPRRVNIIMETLKRGFLLGAFVQKRQGDFEWLFDLRDAALHFKPVAKPLVPHPAGRGNTSQEAADYSVGNAKRAIDLLMDTLGACESAQGGEATLHGAPLLDQLRSRRRTLSAG